MARQRLVKACGTFIYQHCIKENGNYTKFILPVLDEVLAFEVEQDYQKQINYSLIELRTVIEKQLDVKT